MLRFKLDDVLYEFQVLPNGLACGPRIFTKITKPIFSCLRKNGHLNSCKMSKHAQCKSGSEVGRNWSLTESSKEHIKFLELEAVWFVLRSLVDHLTNVHIGLLIDNTTALFCINNMGGNVQNYNELTREIWLWCKSKNIWLSATWEQCGCWSFEQIRSW